MAKLLGKHRVGDRIEKYWMHWGDDGKKKLTVETIEDAEPAFKKAKALAGNRYKDMHYVASIPATLIDEISRVSAGKWGVSVREAYREIVNNKTDRAQSIWRMLTQSRDYSKLQGKSYR